MDLIKKITKSPGYSEKSNWLFKCIQKTTLPQTFFWRLFHSWGEDLQQRHPLYNVYNSLFRQALLRIGSHYVRIRPWKILLQVVTQPNSTTWFCPNIFQILSKKEINRYFLRISNTLVFVWEKNLKQCCFQFFCGDIFKTTRSDPIEKKFRIWIRNRAQQNEWILIQTCTVTWLAWSAPNRDP